MRKLVLCTILILMVLGLVACRGANEAPATQWSHGYGAHMRTLADDFDSVAFELPLTGGRGSLFGFGGDSVAAPASAPGATAAPPPPRTENAASPHGQTDWEEVAESGDRLIIQNANVELETEYFREAEAALRQLAPAVNGFIESDMLTTRGRARFTIVMRVPAASFETVLAQVEGLAYVRSSNQWAQDVTDQFYDMAGSYRIRRLEEERILALIEQAETVQELLALEQRLSNTRLSIEMYMGQLNHMAGQIAYSTITVTLIDVSEIPVVADAPGLGSRVGGAFGDSVGGTVNAVQNVVVFMAGAIFPLVILVAIAFAVYAVIRKARKKINA